MTNEGLSIIIPTYKTPKFLYECLESIVKQQVHFKYEILIGIDNCQETLEHILENKFFYEQFKIYFFEEPSGPFLIKNTLSKDVEYNKIVFFDSDDLFVDGLLKHIYHFGNKHDICRLPYQEFLDGNKTNTWGKFSGEGVFVIKTSVFYETGGFENWKCCADTEFLERYLAQNKDVWHFYEPKFLRRVHPTSLTQRKSTMDGSTIRNDYRLIINDRKQRNNWKKPEPKDANFYRVTLNSKNYLPNFDKNKFVQVWVGDNQRYATATAVDYVSNNKIVVACYLTKTVYYIKLLKHGYKILDSVKLKYYCDLMKYKDGIVVTSNFPHDEIKEGSISVMKINDDKIEFVKDIVFDVKYRVHGCEIINSKTALISSTSDSNSCLMFVNLEDGTFKEFNNYDYYAKDMHLFDDRMLMVTSISRPGLKEYKVHDSYLYLYEFPSMKIIDKIRFWGQTDSITLSGQDGFITLQASHNLLHFKLINDSLIFVGHIGGYTFPHGITSNNEKLIVTNYGDNSFDIKNILELS